MASRVTVYAAGTDLNSNREIAASTWIRWATSARLAGFRQGPLGKLLTTSMVMVRAQCLRMLARETIGNDTAVVATQRPHSMAQSSFTLRCTFTVSNRVVAQVTCVMVNVDVAKQERAPLPDWMRTDIQWDVAPDAHSPSPVPRELARASSALNRLANSPKRTTHEVLTRPSDEDMLRHVTHWRYVQFFEDALVHVSAAHDNGPPDVFYVDYAAQVHQRTLCEVQVPASAVAGDRAPDELPMYLFVKGSSTPACRAYVEWNSAAASAL